MRTPTPTLTTIVAALGFVACSGEPTEPGGFSPREVVRPTATNLLSLGQTTHALPAELVGVEPLFIETLGAQTLIGGSGGLFEIGIDGATKVDDVAVTGMTRLDGVGIVVATASGVSVWSGSLLPSPLSEALSSMSVSALAPRGTELWLGTSAELYRFDTDHLDAFVDIADVSAIRTYQGASRLIVEGADGSHRALREAADGTWSTQAIDEVELDEAVTISGDRIVGRTNGELLERIATDATNVAWRSVALSSDEADDGAKDVEFMSVDPVTGALWVVLGADIRRLTGTTVEVLERPATLAAPIAIDVSADGALWIAGATTLSRFGHEGPNVTWANDIAPFAENNCTRCHVNLGIAHPLDTYDDWVVEIDAIIEAVAAARMPQDEKPLVGGNAELIRRWKDGGLEQ